MEQIKNIDEKNVLIVGCMNADLLNEIKELADAKGIHLAVFEDKVVTDYVASRQETADPKSESEKLQDFLDNKSNRAEAETKALTLFNMLTNNGDVTKAEDMVFSEKQVTKLTSLSHSKAKDLLELLRLFGMVEFIQAKSPFTFKFHFGAETRQNSIMLDISEDCALVRVDMERYISAINQTDLADNEKEAKINEMKEVVTKALA